MNEDLRRIHQCVEYITHEIESAILLTSNAFCHMEQAVNTHTTLDPGTLTADECRAREPETTFLINRLQKHRKGIENIMEVCMLTEREVRNCNYPALLFRLERKIKGKIRGLLYEVLYQEFLVDCYQIKLECRQNMPNFARS
ncbi:hypothetical protein CDAR_391541 [Caerostris darwini]|uniref:Uncharacterized protein n=1 Tax=Caerostris darwini TaxID=1538125 RepID=A0AAV4VR40_9ARAC|nr:hypothetical protein CDAR_391541 [Caerostris darwini]